MFAVPTKPVLDQATQASHAYNISYYSGCNSNSTTNTNWLRTTMPAFSDYDTCIRVHPSVSSIPPGAFKDRVDLVEVELHEGLREIGEDAFRGCTSLRKINLVQSLRTIGPHAFYGCASLVQSTFRRVLETVAGLHL